LVTRFAALIVLVIPCLAAGAGTPAQELARQILDAGLDPRACYHVRDLQLVREDARIYLTEGDLMFSRPVDGAPVSAVFSGAVEGGDAEILVMPPSRSERLSLASFTGSPNLDEHFQSAVFIFSDNAHAELMKAIAERGDPEPEPERGQALIASWEPVRRNLIESFEVRILKDLLGHSRTSAGFFYAALVGRRLGNFDLLYDPAAAEQIHVGQVVVRYNHAYFDLWTEFQSRSSRTGTQTPPPDDALVAKYQIDATVDANLKLDATTTAFVVPGPGGRYALEFDISPRMRVTAARVNGEPAEVFQPDSLRSSLILGEINQPFLVIPAKPLEAGREYEVEFKHSGMVISDAGNGVYYVGARGSWYPNRFPQFARYDLTFRCPVDLDLVATGRTIQQTVEGDMRISRHRIDTPVRLAGFNLGRYEHRSLTRGGYSVEVYANRGLEPALESHRDTIVLPPRFGGPDGRRWTVDLAPFPTAEPKVKPGEHLEQLAGEIAGSLEFMASHFGPPVLKTLTVSPIPGEFGQGFPGLIYLSTLAYLDPRFRPPAAQTEEGQLFYSDILYAHETAHQWWGNVVAAASPGDAWLMEALANYSALLYLERRKDSHALDQVLAEYRAHLLAKNAEGHTVDSAGPIVWGDRLSSSKTPNAWETITYEKGSWIMHMLRRRMGEERFLDMLGELRNRYEFRTVTTGEFQALAAAALPPKSVDPHLDNFFDQWVYSTGIPSLKMIHRTQGREGQLRVTGSITQTEVPDDFSVWVPLEIQFPKGRPLLRWLRTATGSTPFSIAVRQAPTKVTLDPDNSVLRK
jgi:hypothetical protein